MFYNIFNILAVFINGDLAAIFGRGILSPSLMIGKCNCYLTYNINGNCVYEGK